MVVDGDPNVEMASAGLFVDVVVELNDGLKVEANVDEVLNDEAGTGAGAGGIVDPNAEADLTSASELTLLGAFGGAGYF